MAMGNWKWPQDPKVVDGQMSKSTLANSETAQAETGREAHGQQWRVSPARQHLERWRVCFSSVHIPRFRFKSGDGGHAIYAINKIMKEMVLGSLLSNTEIPEWRSHPRPASAPSMNPLWAKWGLRGCRSPHSTVLLEAKRSHSSTVTIHNLQGEIRRDLCPQGVDEKSKAQKAEVSCPRLLDDLVAAVVFPTQVSCLQPHMAWYFYNRIHKTKMSSFKTPQIQISDKQKFRPITKRSSL